MIGRELKTLILTMIETILRKLVSFPTVSKDLQANHEAIAYVTEFLRARGMHIATYEYDGHPALVATVRPGVKRLRVMLYAHVDVVGARAELLRLEKREGRYYGRGAFDMKFAIAVYLALIDELADDLASYDMGIMIVSDEEIGGEQGAAHLVELDYQPEVCIMPDGGEGWNIETYAKGYVRLRIETQGISAHGSRPWEGDNALVSLITLMHRLEALFPEEHEREGNTINIGYIRGGEAVNQIPDHAEMGLDIRFISAEDEVLLMRAINAACIDQGASVTILARGAAVHTDLMHPYVRTFAEKVTEVTGKIPQPHRSYGASDAAFFADKGTICIVTAPDAGGRHAPNEWIDARGVEQFQVVLRKYLTAVARVAPTDKLVVSEPTLQANKRV